MVKPNYTPLKELDDQSKDIKVKVKVISKGDPKQTPPKRRYQKLLLKDDEGTAIDGTIFGDDIEMFEQAIVKNGQYEFSNMVVKPVPESFRARAAGNYQINFNSNVRIIPLDLSDCSAGPQYRKLDKIPRSYSVEDELIDIVGIVLFVGAVRTIKHDEIEIQVRDIIVTDQSVNRPVKISARNRHAEQDVSFFKSWAEGFPTVGFCGVQPITYRGLSLKTGESTEFVEDLNGEIANALRSWIEEKRQMLEDWRGKAIQVYSETTNKTPTPLSAMEKKKANCIWQDERFWIQVTMSALEAREILCYIGCSKCGKKTNSSLETTFVCSTCHAGDATAVTRVLMNIVVYDNTGSLKVTAFTSEVELMLGMKADQIALLKQSDNKDPFEKKIADLRKKEILLQITPTNDLFVNNVLKWIIRAVEVPAEEE